MRLLKKLFNKSRTGKEEIELDKESYDVKSILREEIAELQEELDEIEKEDVLVDKNSLATDLEKQGDIEKAIQLYEECIAENFEGSHPYNRLAIIYRKQNKYKEEERVLKKAVHVFGKIVNKKRAGRDKKLQEFKDRLKIVQEKYINRNKQL